MRSISEPPSVESVGTTEEAEGWFEDPYRIHRQRWFSAGSATGLVRDGATESTDPPPDEPFEGPLVMADTDSIGRTDGSDLLRAGDGRRGPDEQDRIAEREFLAGL